MTPRLFLYVLSLSARRTMSYRMDFWLTALVGFVATFGVAWFLWRAMFDSAGTATIGGYSFQAMMLYMVAVALFKRLVRAGSFDDSVRNDIYAGLLNRYLVLPASYLPLRYAQEIGSLLPSLVQLLVFGVVFAFFVGVPADVEITPLGMLLCGLTLLVAHALYFLLAFPLDCAAFWADNVWSLGVALSMVTGLLGGALIPLALFPTWAQEILAWTPFPLLFYVPAQMLLGRMDPAVWARMMLVAIAWCVLLRGICAWTWGRGRLRYSGVGM